MGLSSLFKSAINVLMGNEYFSDSSEEVTDSDYSSNYDTSKYEKVLTQFLSRLPEEERDDEETDEFLENVIEELMSGNVKNTSQGINDAYKNWKLSKCEREQKKNEKISKKQKEANTIIDMLRHYDELSEVEKAGLTDSDSRFYVGRLDEVSKHDAVTEIVYSWLETKTMDESKYELIHYIPDDYLVEKGVKDLDDNTPITDTEYLFRKLVYSRKCNYAQGEMGVLWGNLDYEKYAEYFKRYWLKSGNHPTQIDCDDLIVNRPCFFKERFRLVTPHFHMKKRYFEKECFQSVQVYLFADSLEMIVDNGHLVIRFSEIIDVSLNNWWRIQDRINDINRWEQCGKRGERPDAPEPYLVEITCRNQNKYLLNGEEVEMMELRALIFYFIKNSQ